MMAPAFGREVMQHMKCKATALFSWLKITSRTGTKQCFVTSHLLSEKKYNPVSLSRCSHTENRSPI